MGGLKGKAEGKAGATPDGSQGATTRHDIVRVGWVIDAVPPGKRAARKHQVINGGGTCSSKETRNDPARRATPCPSRYQTFRSLLIGFINRFGGVSVVTEGSFGVHDSGEKDMRFMA